MGEPVRVANYVIIFRVTLGFIVLILALNFNVILRCLLSSLIWLFGIYILV